MFFSKKKPEAPPITDEAKYVAWFIEYSDELAFLRKLFNLRGFVKASTEEALRELSNFRDGDALFNRLTELAEAYQKFKPLIDARGGLHRCPPEMLGSATNIILNITVIEEMLKKKYKHPEAIRLLNLLTFTDMMS